MRLISVDYTSIFLSGNKGNSLTNILSYVKLDIYKKIDKRIHNSPYLNPCIPTSLYGFRKNKEGFTKWKKYMM